MAIRPPAQPTRKPRHRWPLQLAVPLGLGLAGCGATPAARQGAVPVDRAAHAPSFARLHYAPFGRDDAVAIALREWRLWGQLVDDEPPNARPPPLPDDKPERVTGLWQRVGEYWWLGMNADSPEAGWTGKHDADGQVFLAARDETYAWSAAFISYVMRIAGAGPQFPYSATHATYINAAAEMSQEGSGQWALAAQAPQAALPRQGDLICFGRNGAGKMRFEELPAGPFASHCDLVVAASPGSLTVIGGNVDDAVTMKHVPTTPEGKLSDADGTPVDPRYPWFVVIRVLYER